MIRKVLDRDGATLEEWERTTYKVMNEYVALTMVSMMRGVVQGGTAAAAQVLGVPLAGKTGTVNDHTDVWFIGYTPTYVTGVWMGYPGKKKPLGNEMTGARGALPMFIDFMKTFLKDKEKEDFPKAPDMPEDMRELFRQRQRELAAERAELAAQAKTDEDTVLPAATTEPKLEQMTLPPPPKAETGDQPKSPPKAEATTPKIEAPPPATTRPREAEPAKKKGKKGDGEP
jgi:penicillin-binding protein 1A